METVVARPRIPVTTSEGNAPSEVHDVKYEEYGCPEYLGAVLVGHKASADCFEPHEDYDAK